MLNDARIRTLKPRPSVYRVADRDGLCLEIRPTGARLWRMRYRKPVTGKPTMLALGEYPRVGLQEARRACSDARALLADGTDPADARRTAAAAGGDDSFRTVAAEWLEKRADWSPATLAKAKALLATWAYPWIGKRAMRDITPTDMLHLLRRPETQGKIETAQRLKQRCGQIFRYGIPTGRCERDPTADLRGVLRTVKTQHRAAIKDRRGVGELMRSIDAYGGSYVTQCALKLSALTFVRPGELRHAEWSELDIESAQWHIPAAKMKMGEPHIVPLASQALAIIEDLRAVTGNRRWLFPSSRGGGRPMSENTVNMALKAMGYDGSTMVAHGFRSTASTLLNEAGWNPDWIERQLAHAEPNAIRGAYNYAQWLPDRRRMMQAW
ncbi:MAG: integrase arm-type DNA-binding domain-containing protein, partial [Rhodanobacter sp.]